MPTHYNLLSEVFSVPYMMATEFRWASSDIIAELGEMKLSIWRVSNDSGITEGLKDWSRVLASVSAVGCKQSDWSKPLESEVEVELT
jgi:hypothetical protein